MKKILCSDTTCIHNEDTKINGAPVLVCAICEDIVIHTYNDKCDKYEEIEKYLNRIK